MKHYVGNSGIGSNKHFPNTGWIFPCIHEKCRLPTSHEYIYDKYKFKVSMCNKCQKCPAVIRYYKIYLRRYQYLKGVRYKVYDSDDGDGDIVILNCLIRVIS